jgi:hypothetical protein
MKATNFLYIAGGCFVLAAAFRYWNKLAVATALYVPGVIFLLIGVVLLIHSYWSSRRKSP